MIGRGQIKQYLFVVRELTGREIKRKYARSYLGIVWSVLNPLLSMAVMSMIFSTMFKHSIENYPIYYLTGTILWSFFTNATNTAMTALVDNKPLLLRTKLPMLIFPLTRCHTAFVNLGYSAAAYIVFLIIFKIRPSVSMFVIVPIVILLLLFSAGLGLLLSTVYVFFGDIRHLYGIVLQLWMFCSALFYPVSSLSGTMQKVVMENPMYCFIEAARECMMYGNFPDTYLWFRMNIWTAISLVIGYLFFYCRKNDIMQKV